MRWKRFFFQSHGLIAAASEQRANHINMSFILSNLVKCDIYVAGTRFIAFHFMAMTKTNNLLL